MGSPLSALHECIHYIFTIHSQKRKDVILQADLLPKFVKVCACVMIDTKEGINSRDKRVFNPERERYIWNTTWVVLISIVLTLPSDQRGPRHHFYSVSYFIRRQSRFRAQPEQRVFTRMSRRPSWHRSLKIPFWISSVLLRENSGVHLQRGCTPLASPYQPWFDRDLTRPLTLADVFQRSVFCWIR